MKSGSRTYIQHIDCIHQGHLVNQGITMCNAGHDPSKCDTCPYKESKDMEVTESWTSTGDDEEELYYDATSGKLINFEP